MKITILLQGWLFLEQISVCILFFIICEFKCIICTILITDGACILLVF